MKLVSRIVLILFFLSMFSSRVFSQKEANVKSTGIKSGILIPVGDLADSWGVGFMVADLTKWSISKYVRVIGRIEVTIYGGKEAKQLVYPGPSPIYYTYTTNPLGIITAGSGFEFNFISKNGFYGMLDFPSMNIILAEGSDLRVGFGAGIGYEFFLGKSLFGIELKTNLYNAFLTKTGENSLVGIHLGFETAF